MKKLFSVIAVLALIMSVSACAFASDYVIRIYSNSNSSERVTWLKNEAKSAGFIINSTC